jgi:hypothetical protein
MPSTVKVTRPVGTPMPAGMGEIVAVKVAAWPNGEGEVEATRVVALAAGLTCWVRAVALPWKSASPD